MVEEAEGVIERLGRKAGTQERATAAVQALERPMMISAPLHFEHAGQLPQGLVGEDPRIVRPPERVVIDLRYCQFVRPPAALWCLVYPLLVVHQGQACVVTVPEDIGVARYLKTIGLFDLLADRGVEVDDRGIAPV